MKIKQNVSRLKKAGTEFLVYIGLFAGAFAGTVVYMHKPATKTITRPATETITKTITKPATETITKPADKTADKSIEIDDLVEKYHQLYGFGKQEKSLQIGDFGKKQRIDVREDFFLDTKRNTMTVYSDDGGQKIEAYALKLLLSDVYSTYVEFKAQCDNESSEQNPIYLDENNLIYLDDKNQRDNIYLPDCKKFGKGITKLDFYLSSELENFKARDIINNAEVDKILLYITSKNHPDTNSFVLDLDRSTDFDESKEVFNNADKLMRKVVKYYFIPAYEKLDKELDKELEKRTYQSRIELQKILRPKN